MKGGSNGVTCVGRMYTTKKFLLVCAISQISTQYFSNTEVLKQLSFHITTLYACLCIYISSLTYVEDTIWYYLFLNPYFIKKYLKCMIFQCWPSKYFNFIIIIFINKINRNSHHTSLHLFGWLKGERKQNKCKYSKSI